jgi:cell division ATPase FtsA
MHPRRADRGWKTVRILGVGIEPSEGIKKGTIVDLEAASQSIIRSVERAESTSGLEITARWSAWQARMSLRSTAAPRSA